MAVILNSTLTTPNPYSIEDIGSRDIVLVEFPVDISLEIPEAEVLGSEELFEDIAAGVITAVDGSGNQITTKDGAQQQLRQTFRFTLNGAYWQQGPGSNFDGPVVAPFSADITEVRVAQGEGSANSGGSVTIDVMIAGVSIWATTTPPTLIEESSVGVVVPTAPGDSRSVATGDLITVEFSSVVAPTGYPRDISVEVDVEA